jgi:hypothetical protein
MTVDRVVCQHPRSLLATVGDDTCGERAHTADILDGPSAKPPISGYSRCNRRVRVRTSNDPRKIARFCAVGGGLFLLRKPQEISATFKLAAQRVVSTFRLAAAAAVFTTHSCSRNHNSAAKPSLLPSPVRFAYGCSVMPPSAGHWLLQSGNDLKRFL